MFDITQFPDDHPVIAAFYVMRRAQAEFERLYYGAVGRPRPLTLPPPAPQPESNDNE